MGIFKRLRDAFTEPSLDDAHLYTQIEKELASGYVRNGIWTKALAESNFDEAKAHVFYTRMAAKALKDDPSDNPVAKESIRKQNAMNQAVPLFYLDRYEEAFDGLVLRFVEMQDGHAAVCLAYIALSGRVSGVHEQAANEFMDFAERSTDAITRYQLGRLLQDINWQRALNNYDYAEENGNRDAAIAAGNFRAKLRTLGLIS